MIVHDIASLPTEGRGVHLAIGMFDGVHLGHQSVIETALHTARRRGGIAAVLTFDPHPSRLFRPDSPTLMMLPPAIKARLLLSMGIDAVVIQPFTRELGSVPAPDFLGWLKARQPALQSVSVGANFRFGQRRLGDIATLVESSRAQGVAVFSTPYLEVDGQPVSSTRIRGLLAEGRVAEANLLLGRNYSSCAPVVPGRQLGRTLGFPTFNMEWSPELRPRAGVYAVLLRHPSGGILEGVANYGSRPTLETPTPTPLLEVHCMRDPGPMPKDTPVQVDWIDFIRPELRFDSLDVLRQQIAADKLEASIRLARHRA